MARVARPKELDWNDLQVVLAICRAGSLAGAARDLGCTHSTVYRRITAIEKTAGVRFFERLPTGYVMTEAGQIAMVHGERVETEFHELSSKVLGRDTELRGEVSITCPEGLISSVLPGILHDFRKLHPRVSFEVLHGNRAFDLRRREADIAVRATRMPPDDLIGRRIGDFRFGAYASPAYMEEHGHLELHEHDLVSLKGTLGWMVPHIYKTMEQAEERVVLRTSSLQGSIQAVRDDVGMLMMSCYSMDQYDGVVRIGPTLPFMDLNLWVLTHPALKHTARVKATYDFLVVEMQKLAPLFAGEKSTIWES